MATTCIAIYSPNQNSKEQECSWVSKRMTWGVVFTFFMKAKDRALWLSFQPDCLASSRKPALIQPIGKQIAYRRSAWPVIILAFLPKSVFIGRGKTILSSSCDAKIKQDILILQHVPVAEWSPSWLSPTVSSDTRPFYSYSVINEPPSSDFSKNEAFQGTARTPAYFWTISMMQTSKFMDNRMSHCLVLSHELEVRSAMVVSSVHLWKA